MMIKPVGRLSSNYAAFNWMNSVNAVSGLTSFGSNSINTLKSEQNLRANMLNDSFNYKTAVLQEATIKKLSDENIKRTFSTFA